VAVHLLAVTQACELRGGIAARPNVAAMVESVRAVSPTLDADRCLDIDIEAVALAVSSGALGHSLGGEA
jgi:histidine ammonia-lyase